MYYPASDTIAAKWPQWRDAIEQIDQLFHDNAGELLLLEVIYQFAEESPRTIDTIIREYEKNGNLERIDAHVCREHPRVPMQALTNESTFYCDLCDQNYEVQELKTTQAVKVKMPENTATESREVSPSRVLISYSHDSKDHAARVLKLSDKLREHGIDCRIDQYEPVPQQGWPVWMEQQIEKADFVICICTEEYAKRFKFESEAGVGRGVAWEASLVRNALYLMPGENKKFLTAQFDKHESEAIPTCLQQYTNFVITNFEFAGGGYERLYRHLTWQPGTPPLKFGKVVELLENRGTNAPERIPALQFVQLERTGQLLQSPSDLRAGLKSVESFQSSTDTPCEIAKRYLQWYQLAELEAIHQNDSRLREMQSKKESYKKLVDEYCKDMADQMHGCPVCDTLNSEIQRLQTKLAEAAGASDQNYFEKEIEKKSRLLKDHICKNPK